MQVVVPINGRITVWFDTAFHSLGLTDAVQLVATTLHGIVLPAYTLTNHHTSWGLHFPHSYISCSSMSSLTLRGIQSPIQWVQRTLPPGVQKLGHAANQTPLPNT
jgi:hypothetical protein